MFAPKAISSLDESKDRVAIHIEEMRNPPGEKNILKCKDMIPGSFLFF